jgi:predicted ATPase/class 3 adenylate cyclase
MARLPSGTVTMLFTDVVGSTRLLQQLGDGYQPVIADHHRLLREEIQAHGHEVEDRGDGLFAVFTRAVDALAAAVAAQRTLSAHPWPACPACPDAGGEGGGSPVQVRMGLHTGDPTLVGSNYVGLDVHRAARLCDAGHGGQVLLSAATRELVERHLPDDITLRDLGEHRLRDLQRPERIYQAVIAGLPADFPPPRTVNGRPHNLPTARAPIIGRDDEVGAARDLLLRDDVGLVTLTGPGGAGKTRLGLQIASAMLDQFEDGVFLVLLAPISDPALVPATIARALGLREATDRPIVDTLTDHLRERQVLLLLDNFEQILPAAPIVADLLAVCPRLKVLVTSRAPLRVRGERELPVPPLDLPTSGAPISAERLQQFAAVALFAERAREVRPDFAITTENAPAVAEICQRLDGLPLAIELATARVRLLSPQAMLGRLGCWLPFLTGGSRDLPARQQTLRDTIGWSYDQLDPAEQRLFRRLGVFVGGCTLDAAEAVATDEGLGVEDAESVGALLAAPTHSPLDLIGSLLDKSLLRQVDGPGDEPRFMMLETIREYALEQLEASGEADDVRRRHADYFAQFCERAEPELIHTSDRDWFDRVDAEHNIRAALAWCSATESAHELMPRLANPLWIFWWLRGHWAEARRWYDRVLELSLDPLSHLGALWGLGQILIQAGDYARATAIWDEAILLAEAHGDRRTLARTLSRRSHTAMQVGDLERAQQWADQSLAISRELGDQERIAVALHEYANISRARGDEETARVHWEEALRLARAAGFGYYLPYAVANLAVVAINLGEFDRAIALAEEAFDLFRRRDDRWGIQGYFSNLSRIGRLRGDRDRTSEFARESLSMAWALGSRISVVDSMRYLAWVARVDGQPDRAARLRGAVAALHEATGRRTSRWVREEGETETALLRETLGDSAFEAAWNEGRAMSVDQAVRYALEEIDVKPGGPRA